MKVTTRYLKASVAAFAVAACLLSIFTQETACAGVAKKDGFYVVTLEGTPYDIGYQQGSLLKDEIKDIYDIYLNDLVYQDWVKKFALIKGESKIHANPRKGMWKFADGTREFIPDEYLEEMKGLADGAGIDIHDVMNMTAHVDFFSILMCSVVVTSGEATPDNKLVEARNLDWADGGLQELDKYSTIFVVRPDRGHSFVSVIYPGIVGALTAVNDQKLTVELNFVMTADKQKRGFPALLMVRHIAQNASNLDEAEKILRDIPRMAGYNLTITDGKTNEARTIEVTAGTVGAVPMSERGVLVSTNHYISSELASTNPTGKRPTGLPSTVRFDRLTELSENHYGEITPAVAVEMIHDGSVKVDSTVQSVVFKPADELMLVWSRSRPAGDFAEFNVAELLAAER